MGRSHSARTPAASPAIARVSGSAQGAFPDSGALSHAARLLGRDDWPLRSVEAELAALEHDIAVRNGVADEQVRAWFASQEAA